MDGQTDRITMTKTAQHIALRGKNRDDHCFYVLPVYDVGVIASEREVPTVESRRHSLSCEQLSLHEHLRVALHLSHVVNAICHLILNKLFHFAIYR